MRMSVLLVGLLPCISSYAAAQSADWATVFRAGASGSEAVRENVRQKGASELIPRVVDESGEDALADASAIAAQLENDKGEIRLQASGYLFMMASSRRDSAVVLRAAFPAINAHLSDSSSEVKTNLVNTIGSLNPSIPDDELKILAKLLAPANPLAKPALNGIARMGNQSGLAFDTLSEILAKRSALTISAVDGIGSARMFNERLVRQVVPFLQSEDHALQDAALRMIEALGSPAIALSRDKLRILAETSGDEQLASRARALIDQNQ